MSNKHERFGKADDHGVLGGRCITRKNMGRGQFVQCTNARIPPSWYCAPCEVEFQAERAGNKDRPRHVVPVTDLAQDRTMPRQTQDPGPDADRDLLRARARASITAYTEPSWERHGGGHTVKASKGTGTGTASWGGHAGIPILGGHDRPKCEMGGAGHDGSAPFYTLPDGRVLYGAQGSRLNHPGAVTHLDLIIDCANLVTGATKFVKRAPNRRFASLNMAEFPDVLKLDWPDMSAPVHIGLTFWIKLLALLPQHTAVCCVGSHGRTGTALACLLVASGMDPDKAIVTVRTQHCQRAIETAGQEKYIRDLKAGGAK